MNSVQTPRAAAPIVLALLMSLASSASAFEFNFDNSCVLFNADNTDILIRPDDCFNLPPEDAHWCDCTRTTLTNPIRGEATVFEQGVIWVTEDPGIGNHRVEVDGGTLDLSGLVAGDVIGETLTNELVPESVGVPPGTFFTMRSEIIVTGVDANTVSLDIRVAEVSVIVGIILGHSPFDEAHSNGLLYRAELVAGGPDGGFVFEYRYEAEEGASSPAVEPGDAGSPGFNVRFGVSLFTGDGEGIYTLSAADSTLNVLSTLRKFTDAGGAVENPDEIRPFGEDLCEVLEGGELNPCREFVEDLTINSTGGENGRPEAIIVATDIQLQPLIDNELFVDCGEGRAILRGSNSTDGDGGSQGLSFQWEVLDEPSAGAAIIPAETATFMDTEVSFLEIGEYTIRLTVDDGQATNNTDTAEVTIEALEGVGPNEPPRVNSLTYRPDGTTEVEIWDPVAGEVTTDIEIELVAGSATVVDLDLDTDAGADGCFQENSYLWEVVDPPAPVTISAAIDEETDLTFTAEGEYLVRVTIDDGAPENNTTVIELTVVVFERAGVGPFLRGDCAQEGSLSLTSGIFLLNFLFLGGDTPQCRAACDANGDGNLDISTAVYLFNFLFLGGPPPPAAECGVSSRPMDVTLGCETPQECP